MLVSTSPAACGVRSQGYFSGGSGYVLSSEALRRFAGRNRTLCREDGGSEDVEMGRCMQALDVRPGESRDALNRTRFHVFAPERHIHGDMGKWFHTYSKYKQLKVCPDHRHLKKNI